VAKREGTDGLTPLQHRFVEALLTGKNVTQAALLAGCSRRAAMYWLRDADSPVRMAYESRRIASIDDFDRRMMKLHELTLKTMEDLLSPKVAPALRFQAAKLLYEAHLAEHGELKQAKASHELVNEGAHDFHDEQREWGMTDILLYDAKGQERINDDD